MANVRIKDITTTASAPNDDDYLAIDGATSGTRKVLAKDLQTGTDTTLSVSGQAADAKAVGDAIEETNDNIGDLSELETTDKSSVVNAINEAAQTGNNTNETNVLPALYLNGDITNMSKNTAVVLQYDYIDENLKNQRTGWLKCKWQGESSLNYPKKNFNLTFYHDALAARKDKIKFMEDCKQSKWTAKANWIDHSQARNIISAKLWTSIVKSRHSAPPTGLSDSPRYGAIDGYPIAIYINNEYHGLYTLNIKKDDFTFGMDEDNPLHCAICGDLNNDGDTSKTLSSEFRLASTTGWEVEVPSTFTSDTRDGLIALINFVMTSTDEDFYSGLDTYLDVESAIDYYIFVYFIGAFDNLARNLILLTYDGGSKWYCSAYDLDSTFGMKAYGQLEFPSNGAFQSDYAETNSLLWERLADNFNDEIYTRYQELRSSILNVSYIHRAIDYFMSEISDEDYLADVEKWPTMPNPRVDHMSQMKTFISERAVYVDRKMAQGATVIDLTSVNISDSTLSLVENVKTGMNPTYFTDKNVTFTQYRRINSSTGEVSEGTDANHYSTVDIVNTDQDSAVIVNPDKAKIFDTIVLYNSDDSFNSSKGVWYSPYNPQGASQENHTNNTSFMFPLGWRGAFGVSGARVQLSAATAGATSVNKAIIATLKGWTMVSASDIPSGSGDVYTSALVPVSAGDIVFLRTVNASGDTANYYTGILEYETQAATSYTAIEDTTEPLKWRTIASGFTYVGFKVARNLYNNGGHLEYIVISGGENSIITENSLGWDDQTLTVSITPANATIESVEWTSSNLSVLTIIPSAQDQYSVVVHALSKGTSTVTCTITDTGGTIKTASCTITVS